MIRFLIAVGLIVHGLIHLFGCVVPWRLVKMEDMPHSTAVLAGKVNLGDVGIRVFGVLWPVAAIGFVAAGVGLIAVTPWWPGLTLGITVFSMALCILGWPDARFGVFINLVILTYLVFGGQLGWLPQL